MTAELTNFWTGFSHIKLLHFRHDLTPGPEREHRSFQAEDYGLRIRGADFHSSRFRAQLEWELRVMAWWSSSLLFI